MSTPSKVARELADKYGSTKTGIWILKEALRISTYPEQTAVDVSIGTKSIKETPGYLKAE